MFISKNFYKAFNKDGILDYIQKEHTRCKVYTSTNENLARLYYPKFLRFERLFKGLQDRFEFAEKLSEIPCVASSGETLDPKIECDFPARLEFFRAEISEMRNELILLLDFHHIEFEFLWALFEDDFRRSDIFQRIVAQAVCSSIVSRRWLIYDSDAEVLNKKLETITYNEVYERAVDSFSCITEDQKNLLQKAAMKLHISIKRNKKSGALENIYISVPKA